LSASTVSVRADDTTTCKQIDQILAELQQLRSLLQASLSAASHAAPAPANPGTPVPARTTKIDVASAPFLGSKDAPYTIVEFTDFQCPYCRGFFQQTFPELKKDYIDTGRVRFYSMDLPLDMHRNAMLAAQAGRCADEQGRFWAMHDRMQGNPDRLEMKDLVADAEEFGIDVPSFRECVETGKYKGQIQQGVRDATSKGAQGTPTFVIGRSTPEGVEGDLVVGAVGYGVFEQKLGGVK
jgi:protein-disulfide isomerase